MSARDDGPVQGWLGDRLLSRCPVGDNGRPDEVVVVHDDEYGDLHLVTSHSGVAEVYRNPLLTRAATTESRVRLLNAHISEHAIPLMEGPERLAARAVITPLFSKAAMEAMRPVVRAIVEEAVDDMEREGPPADLVHHLARPLPARAVAHVMGLPDVDPYEFSRWAELVSCVDGDVDKAAPAIAGLARLGMRIWRAERDEPDRDSFGGRVIANSGADPRAALAQRVGDMIVGGCENSTVFIQTGLIGLLTSGRYARLCADPGLIPGAVEELLRVHPPGQFGLPRTAVADTEVAGVPIPAGTTVLPAVGRANVDPRAHPAGAAFVVDQVPHKQHMSFGFGPRYCPGAPLGRLEMAMVLEVVTRRLPNLRLAVPREELRPRCGNFVDGFVEVPLTW